MEEKQLEEKKIKAAEKKNEKARYFFYSSGIFLLLSVAVLALVLSRSGRKAGFEYAGGSGAPNEIREDNELISRKIDGVMARKGSQDPFLAAVMIDNHVEARPPAGLNKASLVFEAEAEGGITRFLAIFTLDQNIDKIGPIRSARPYFADWAEELGALYVHVGGSPAALAKIAKENIPDINEFYNEDYFWRGSERSAPHNVFTSTDLLNDYIKEKNLKPVDFKAWPHKSEPDDILPEIKGIKIGSRLQGYETEWKYDKENNDFIRYGGDKPYKTAAGDIITAKNLLIAHVDYHAVDEELRLEMENIGEGRAIVCLDGNCREGRWEKPSERERLAFFIEEKPAVLNRGLSWIEIVGHDREVFVEQVF